MHYLWQYIHTETQIHTPKHIYVQTDFELRSKGYNVRLYFSGMFIFIIDNSELYDSSSNWDGYL